MEGMIRYLFIGLAVCIVIFGGARAYFNNRALESAWTPENMPPAGVLSVSGTIACLPHANQSGAVTLECAIGLAGDDGNYYGLTNLPQDAIVSGAITTGQSYTASGYFTPRERDEKYAIVGTISVGEESLPTLNPSKPVGDCIIGGCSGQLCGEAAEAENEGLVSTCEYRPEYACYQSLGRCERQPTGQCGWTQTPELARCIASAGSR